MIDNGPTATRVLRYCELVQVTRVLIDQWLIHGCLYTLCTRVEHTECPIATH
jgi:hypothetical protein